MFIYVSQLHGGLGWYGDELLSLAKDLATRLLPAFNTSTGLPYPRVCLCNCIYYYFDLELCWHNYCTIIKKIIMMLDCLVSSPLRKQMFLQDHLLYVYMLH